MEERESWEGWEGQGYLYVWLALLRALLATTRRGRKTSGQRGGGGRGEAGEQHAQAVSERHGATSSTQRQRGRGVPSRAPRCSMQPFH
jgi:hypothetical protein